MEIKKILIMFVLLLSCILGAQAQESIVVTGVVTDKNKEPLVGVNITVGDMVGLGTITDINGKYKIKMEPYHRLIFSYIGFDIIICCAIKPKLYIFTDFKTIDFSVKR